MALGGIIYCLLLFFLIFNGLPQGFAYTICFLYFISALLIYFFIEKEFGDFPALFFLILFGFSPYLIFISTFVVNSGFTIPFIFLFLFSLYQFLKDKKSIYLFLLFLSTGFIFEAQVSFGLFLIPALILTLIIDKIRLKTKDFIYAIFGLFISFLPRILFEIKNNFLQTKTFLNFLFHPKYHNQKLFKEIIFERFALFKDYYLKIFNHEFLGYTILFLTLISFFLYFKKLKLYQKKFLKSNLTLIIFVFILSLFYKDNFWPNYLEGFSVFYLPILTFSFYLIYQYGNKLLKLLFSVIFIFMLIFNINKFFNEIKNKNPVEDGLIKQDKVIQTLYQENNYKDFCLRIYTPPVIPYTYQYLIDYYSRTKKYPKPKNELVEDKCWFIIEDDEYKFRIENWRKENIPTNFKKIKSNRIYKDIVIELWSI
jgi:4-amino-4-deoxy-L-arabinose transferase-like glycosyltransferase